MEKVSGAQLHLAMKKADRLLANADVCADCGRQRVYVRSHNGEALLYDPKCLCTQPGVSVKRIGWDEVAGEINRKRSKVKKREQLASFGIQV